MGVYFRIIGLILSPFLVISLYGQSIDSSGILDYKTKEDYEIGGIKVKGANFSDERAIIAVSGLTVGDNISIPGFKISKAVKALWRLRLFDDVQIVKEKVIGNVVFLEIVVQEPPRYSRHFFAGVKKSLHDDLNAEINRFLVKGGILSENEKANVREAVQNYFIEKGYLDVAVDILVKKDDRKNNAVMLVIKVDQKERTKIKDIHFTGIEAVKAKKLKKLMAGTKEKSRLFNASKFIQPDFEMDKKQLVQYYNSLGYRDAQITKDSVWRNEDGELMIDITIAEGTPYYFRHISFKGNSIYPTEQLSQVLGIEKGDVYNPDLLNSRLFFGENGRDISSIYMDDGYLFFRVEPIETAVVDDSVDLEIRIFEGGQATIDKVVIKGNDRTNEHVIRREIRTKPGNKFSRSDIIRSQREIINLGYFNPENLQINTPVNPQNGTVDIEYIVEEKSSDQLELSAGWGGSGTGVIGTLGVSFNNFSLRNMFNKASWNPLPQGDGQRLSLRAQSNGSAFQSYNFSFTEPWLGGKRPNSLSVGFFYTRFSDGVSSDASSASRFSILGGSATLGTRLKWPDDNFVSTTTLNLQKYDLQNWDSGLFRTDDGEIVSEGNYYNFSINQTLVRSTLNNPLFPTEGSRVSLSLQFTPPYSLFSKKDVADQTTEEQFKFLEYHKWRFDAEWYTTLVGKLVLKARAKFGFVGRYNNELGISPFERFQLGGDGLSNQQSGFNGTDIISLRGYETTDLEHNLINGELVATPIYDKFTLELRYPLSLNPSSTIYALLFAEGGNSWQSFRDFNPFDIKRSAGFGLRVFLPMFGTLGFDYGIGFDKVGERSLSNLGRFSIILGFEPE